MSCGYDYYKIFTIKEAIDLYNTLTNESKKVKYLSGGSEIATFYKFDNIALNAVIDIKCIDNTIEIVNKEHTTYFGANTPLSYIYDNSDFQILNKIIRNIADRTSRNTITLGGNILSKIVFREAILPFLICDADVYIGTDNNIKKNSLMKIFNKQLNIQPSEILLGLEITNGYKYYPYQTYKKFKTGKQGYPIITCATIKSIDGIKIAFSGLTNYPFRSIDLEKILNDNSLNLDNKINYAMELLNPIIIEDQLASKDYRYFLTKEILEEILINWSGSND